MNADSYFEIGYSHKVCEDYALAGVQDDVAYAIVSDGCSSSKETDVGARLLAHISRDAILYLLKRKLLYDFSFLNDGFKSTLEEIVIKKCLEVKDTLRLPCEIFDATLLIAIGVGPDWKILFSWGDGYFILKRPSGAIDVVKLEYTSGAPYYMSYELSEDKKDAYSVAFSGQALLKNIDRINLDNSVTRVEEDIISYVMKRSYYSIIGESADVHQIIVSSDGIGTFEADPRMSPVPGAELVKYDAYTMIPPLVSYKNPVGEFVTRRMNRFRKDCETSTPRIIHQDDISCAAINFIT